MTELLHQLGIDPTLIVVNIVGFLLLVLLLKKFMFGPIGQMLADRENDIRSTYDEAEAQKAAMEQLRQDYERRMGEVESEAREKIQSAVKEAQGMRDEIVSEARVKAEDVVRRGEEELAREKDKTLVALRQEVADLVVSASSKLIEKDLDDATHRKLIDDFVSGIGTAK